MIRQLIKHVHKIVYKDMPFDKDFSDEECLSAVKKWVLMLLATCVTGEDFDLHAKLRCDIAALTPVKASSIGTVKIEIVRQLS